MNMMRNLNNLKEIYGLLPLNKPKGKTSFHLVHILRKKLGVQKIGHAGTLDPFATGVMIMLIGRYTKLSDQFLNDDKEYEAIIRLGIETDSYDCDGKVTERSDHIPTQEEIERAIQQFQGEIWQIPPMFSAKKQNGVKLYHLARKGKTVEREPKLVRVKTTLQSYQYPFLTIHVACSKGTYVRSIAYDLGKMLRCGAHLAELQRTRSGTFFLEQCLEGSLLYQQDVDIMPYLIQYENH